MRLETLPSPSHRPSLSCKCGIRLRFGAFCREKRLKGCRQAPLELMGGMGGFLKSVGRLPFENVAAKLLFSCVCVYKKLQSPFLASDFDQPRCPPLPRPGPRRAPLAIIKDGRVLKSGGKIRARRGSAVDVADAARLPMPLLLPRWQVAAVTAVIVRVVRPLV